MKFKLIYFAIALIINQTSIAQKMEPAIDSFYNVGKGEPGFSIAVFKGEKIIFEKQYGVANLDYNIPITNKTVFDIASISKQFTAAAILLLEQQSKLNIKDPVSKYLPKIPNYVKGIPTVEHLLNHTSGIKEVDPYWGILDLQTFDYMSESQMVNIILKVKELQFQPGEYFHYSNANYILLAAIVRQVSGQSLADFSEQHIFAPLEMYQTFIKDDIYRIVDNRAIGYQESEGEWYKTHTSSFVLSGDGQVITTPRDIFKWHQNLKQNTIGTPEIWKKMHTKARLNNGTEINYGLGVEFEMHNGHSAYGHDGMWLGGFVSKYLYFPDQDIAFFTTQNKFEWDFRDRFFQFVDLFLKQNETPIKKEKNNLIKGVDLSKIELRQYEGKYLFFNNENHQQREIKLLKRNLVYQTLDNEVIGELIPIGNHEFAYVEDGDNQSRIKFIFSQKVKQFIFDNQDGEMPKLFQEFVPYEHSKTELAEYVGTFYNKDFQIGKEIKLEERNLIYYYRNGAWKDQVTSISKDLFNTPPSEIRFERNENGEIIGFIMMGLEFEKL
ncbi:MAG: beta-lactamase family protein [Flavobacteriaceae bacterium]|nr:beta-lactamase family protein [Flavobacteriaceae bacterium]